MDYSDLSNDAQAIVDRAEEKWETGVSAGISNWAEAKDEIIENDALQEAIAALLDINTGQVDDALSADGKWGENLDNVSEEDFQRAVNAAVEAHKWRNNWVSGVTD